MTDAPLSTDLRVHTAGPWRWEVNLTSRRVHLVGGKPQYDMTVMDFVRWGMDKAQPRFVVDGLLYKADEFKRVAPQREHHKEWFQLLSHPDANLIAAAPELFALAKQYASECAGCSGRGFTVGDDGISGRGPDDVEPTRYACEDCADIRAVIAKAEGR